MIVWIYGCLLAVINLIALICYLIKRGDSQRDVLISLSAANIIIDALILGYALICYYDTWTGLSIYICSIICIVVNVVIFIIGKITSLVIAKRAKKQETIEITSIETEEKADINESDASKEIDNKKVKRFTLKPKVTHMGKKVYKIVIISTLIVLLVDIGKNVLYSYNVEKNKEKYSKVAIKLLNEKYGDCSFKIEEVDYYDNEDSGLFDVVEPQYRFTISSNLITDTFRVTIYLDNPDEMQCNEFIEKYYEEKYGDESIDYYVEQYAAKILEKEIKSKFNVNVKLNTEIEYFGEQNFGELPTPEYLIKYVKIEDIEIEILDNILNTDQLYEYLTSLTRYFLTSSTSNDLVADLDSGTIFKFKCDYKLLGITNESGEYDDYCGHVTINDDSDVRIYAFDRVLYRTKEMLIKETIEK